MTSLRLVITVTSHESHCVSNLWKFDCLFSCLFRLTVPAISKLRITNHLWSSYTGRVSIAWRHNVPTFSLRKLLKYKHLLWSSRQRVAVLDECLRDGVTTGQHDRTVHTHIHGEHVTILTCQAAQLFSDVIGTQAEQTANQRPGWRSWRHTTWFISAPDAVAA